MFIECLIKRSDDSDTFVDFEQVRYRFSKNDAGDRVCFVGGEAHRRRLLAMGSDCYREYKPPKNLTGPVGATPIPMTRNALKKRPKPPDPGEAPDGFIGDEADMTSPEDGNIRTEVDWQLDKKLAKVKEFRFLKPDKLREFVEANRSAVMDWPFDVRRELAKKIDKLMPEEDPGIDGFKFDDYLKPSSDS